MTDFKVGYSKLNINPPLGIVVCGYYVKRFAKGFLDDLHVKTIAIGCGDKTIIMSSIDVCYLTTELADKYRSHIELKTGISYENIFISATHTHTGPDLKTADVPDVELSKQYIDFLMKRISDSVQVALNDMKTARLGYRTVTAPDNIAFIRRYKMKDGTTMTCPPYDKVDEIDHPIGTLDNTVKRYCKFYDDFLVLLGTGLRISELCGLTLDDLDFNSLLIDVNHQLVGNKKSGFNIIPPKTQMSYRQIPMNRIVYQALQNILARPRPEQYEIDGHKNFLFFNHKGVPRNSKSYRGALDKIIEKYEETDGIELPTISPHIFRHTFCTNMANKGMNPKALQYIMGHKNIRITLDYYAHATSASAKEEMERVMAM